jgi:hypothetical protein
MSNIEQEAVSLWTRFHAWVTLNPGFYFGVAVGLGLGFFLFK